MIFRLGFWGLKVVLAWWVISQRRDILLRFSRWENLVLIIYLIYGINIFIDVFLSNRHIVSEAAGKTDFIGFAVILVLLLSFRSDSAYSSKQSFDFFAITLTIGLIIAYFMARQNLILDPSHIRYDANSTVNSIGYGQSGCALSLVSLFGIINNKKKLIRLLFILSFIVGMLSIAKAGSRSPVVVLLLVMTFYFMAKMGSIKGIFLIFILVVLMFLFIDPILEVMKLIGSDLADRLVSMIENRESSGRDVIWKNVLNIISQSPVIGDYYVVPSGVGKGFYPHNFFLEIFMGTGIIGGLPFIILILYSLKKSYNLININHPATWIIILYLQMIVFGMFSTSLYSSQDFWVLVFYVMSIKYYDNNISRNYEKKVSQTLAIQ